MYTGKEWKAYQIAGLKSENKLNMTSLTPLTNVGTPLFSNIEC